MKCSTAICDSCHVQYLLPLPTSDQVHESGYCESEVQTDTVTLQLVTSATVLELEMDVAGLELETSTAGLELEIDVAGLEMEMNAAGLKLEPDIATLDLETGQMCLSKYQSRRGIQLTRSGRR
jgi:hypothetical protein